VIPFESFEALLQTPEILTMVSEYERKKQENIKKVRAFRNISIALEVQHISTLE